MSSSNAIAKGEAFPDSGPIRVMVVDDSAVIRGLVRQWLDSEPDINVVFTAANGKSAVSNLVSTGAEVVILDIEMPIMDGMVALPLLLQAAPGVKILMASTLTARNAEISLTALSRGAADYIPKPQAFRDTSGAGEYRREIVAKVKALGVARRRVRLAQRGTPSAARPVAAAGVGLPMPKPQIKWRPLSPIRPKVVVIGSSTGGPQALFKVLTALPEDFTLPVVITQHMPATFTAILADHIRRATGRDCVEVQGGEVVTRGHIYIAKGGHHLLLEKKDGEVVLRLDDGPMESFCRPAVDPMFRSAAAVYGPSALAVVLTGMGNDGLKGSEVLINAGSSLIAQNEASSVVWGMPGAVANAGLCSAVLDLDEIAPAITRVAAGAKP
ncbi:MAG TPA: chemotaxis response regulator protein-glutamate methylesterase [Alphaproteobacteria bacterium]|nr:chemotaxis response regulator protein-glutamate methylesterase [Alphaproteobacteria bacterium]